MLVSEPEAQAAVLPLLKPGEELLWAARARVRPSVIDLASTLPAGLVPAIVIWAYDRMGYRTSDLAASAYGLGVVIAVGVVSAAVTFCGCQWLRYRHVFYGLTNLRILVVRSRSRALLTQVWLGRVIEGEVKVRAQFSTVRLVTAVQKSVTLVAGSNAEELRDLILTTAYDRGHAMPEATPAYLR